MISWDSQIKTLISFCEEEKANLHKLIQKCLTEEEYLLAHFHLNALHQLNRRLQTFNNIDDPLYGDKQFKLRKIGFLETQIQDTGSEHMKEHFSKELLKVKDALEKLNNTPPKKANEDGPPLIDEILLRMLDKNVKNVKLILKRQTIFVLPLLIQIRY